MKLTKTVLSLGLALSLSACAAPEEPTVEGPRCTIVYPMGFTVERDVEICRGDIDAAFGTCVQRYNI